MTRKPGREGIEKGGLNDPVAQSIRREQNQAARPSWKEVESEHRKYLKEQGCGDATCDEDDPKKLQQVEMAGFACSNRQYDSRADPFIVLCDDHLFSTQSRSMHKIASRLHTTETDAGAIVMYECGQAEAVCWETIENPHPMSDAKYLPEVNPLHKGRNCDAHLDYILYEDDYHYDD